MSAGKIVVIGSCNTDMVVKSERLPQPGETILGGTFMMNAGGKGANQAVAVARMGGDITFVAKVGQDVFGQQALAGYKKEGIHTHHIFTDPDQPSGVALISVDGHGENCIVVASGANATLAQADIDRAHDDIAQAEIVLMQLEVPIETVEYAAKVAHKKGVKVILNPAPAQPLPDTLLRTLYMIIPNRTEAEILSGIAVTDWESARKAADIISSKGVETVVITLGSMGALIKDGPRYCEVATPRVAAVDTTAAGDTFCGALCVWLSEGMELEEAVKKASRCAAITVTRMGAQSSIPYRNEID